MYLKSRNERKVLWRSGLRRINFEKNGIQTLFLPMTVEKETVITTSDLPLSIRMQAFRAFGSKERTCHFDGDKLVKKALTGSVGSRSPMTFLCESGISCVEHAFLGM